MILQDITLHADQVAAHGHFTWFQVISDTGRFQHAPSFVDGREVVAQHCHVRHFASRMETVGNGLHSSGNAHFGQFVHIGSVRILHWCLAAQGLYRLIGHTVSQDDDTFHNSLLIIVNCQLSIV